MITVSIVEDNVTTLSYLEALLSGSGGIKVLGTYKSGTEALERLPENMPEVLLCDLNLPDMSGIDVIRTINERFDNTDILVLTMHDEKDYIIPAIKAGAGGYILKGTGPAEIIEAIGDIRKGGAPMSPKIARYVLNEFKSIGTNRAEPLLSEREKEVLEGFAKGLSEKKLAAELSLSQHTVHAHIKNIYKKLRVNSRTEAIMKAKSKGIL